MLQLRDDLRLRLNTGGKGPWVPRAFPMSVPSTPRRTSPDCPESHSMRRTCLLVALLFLPQTAPTASSRARTPAAPEYRVLATSRTSTMEKEMNEAANAGFRYVAVMGGETAIGGNEVVTVFSRTAGAKPRYEYRLLATNRTSTMQRELQQAGRCRIRIPRPDRLRHGLWRQGSRLHPRARSRQQDAESVPVPAVRDVAEPRRWRKSSSRPGSRATT